MTHPSGKKWSVKYGWHAHFQNSRGYFTTRWITFAVDNELKVDNKLIFKITSPSNIIVKVFKSTKVVLSADDTFNKNDFKNDIEGEDIVDDEDHKENDEDDDKVVRLANKNKRTLIKKMIPWCSLVLTKMKMMKNYPRTKPHGCINTSTEKVFQNSMVTTKYVNYNTNAIQT